MLSDRLAIAILLIPVALWVVVSGGLVYLGAIFLIFIGAAREYVMMFRTGGHRPAEPIVLAGTLWLIGAQYAPALNPANLVLPMCILAPLTWHLIDYERGATTSGTDFVVTLGGLIYLGGLGSYFIALRQLPDGLWWFTASLSAVWIVDSGAYSFGRAFGKHKFAPRLSPKKTWEGYVGGIISGALGGGLLSLFWQLGAGPQSSFTWVAGAAIGAVVGVLSPIGDLGVSMLKRQSGVKDSGDLIPGHGGVLDRIDSWLVTVTVGYYLALVWQWAAR